MLSCFSIEDPLFSAPSYSFNNIECIQRFECFSKVKYTTLNKQVTLTHYLSINSITNISFEENKLFLCLFSLSLLFKIHTSLLQQT